MIRNDFEKMKRKNLQEVSLSKVSAIVKLCMENLHLNYEYALEPSENLPRFFGKDKKAGAVMSVELADEIALKIILQEIKNDISAVCSKMKKIFEAVKEIKEKSQTMSSEYEIKLLCAEILQNSCEYFFDVVPKGLYFALRAKNENPKSFFDEESAMLLGGGLKISPLITQEQFFWLEGFSSGSFFSAAGPEDNESFLLVMKYCNDLSIFHNRTPCYSLDGETSPQKWQKIMEEEEYSTFFCSKTADGFRLPASMELLYLKKRQKDFFEYVCECDFEERIMPFVSFVEDSRVYPIKDIKDSCSGIAFRVVFRD